MGIESGFTVRDLETGTQKYTKVAAMDGPGHGGASHTYEVRKTEDDERLQLIEFQRGPIKEYGVNGIHHEDLLAIIADRLQGFQSGAYACRENALALTKLEEALHWLRHRTNAREKRGVEGTHEV